MASLMVFEMCRVIQKKEEKANKQTKQTIQQ